MEWKLMVTEGKGWSSVKAKVGHQWWCKQSVVSLHKRKWILALVTGYGYACAYAYALFNLATAAIIEKESKEE